MKRILVCLLLLVFLVPGVVSGYDNNITIGLKRISNDCGIPVDMPICWENDICLSGAWNHFILTADEGLTAWFDTSLYYIDPNSRGGCLPGDPLFQMLKSSTGDNAHPDMIFCGYPYMPGCMYCIIWGPSEPIFHYFIHVEGSYGNLYIDSINVEPFEWIWYKHSNIVCNPTFNYDGSTHVIKYGGFFCGDADGSGGVNLSDAVGIIRYVFVGGQVPDPIESGDVNCDGLCNVSDAIWLINYIFAGGSVPCDTDGDGVPDC